MKKQIKYISAGMLAGMLLCGGQLQASNRMTFVPFQCGREGDSPCTETFKECEVGMDVYQLFPEYIGYNRTFP